jgi:hypothetical protein
MRLMSLAPLMPMSGGPRPTTTAIAFSFVGGNALAQASVDGPPPDNPYHHSASGLQDYGIRTITL